MHLRLTLVLSRPVDRRNRLAFGFPLVTVEAGKWVFDREDTGYEPLASPDGSSTIGDDIAPDVDDDCKNLWKQLGEYIQTYVLTAKSYEPQELTCGS